MLKPLTQFYCDCCGSIIKEPSQGRVEWLWVFDQVKADYIAKEHRIIHDAGYSPHPRMNCYNLYGNGKIADAPLTKFLDAQTGMAELLSFIDPGPKEEPKYTGPGVKDLREYLEFMRRLTIPHYEEARLYWPQAIRDNFFDGGSETFVYDPVNLKRLIGEYEGE